MRDIHPYRFTPIYKEKVWGGRSLERLFGRVLPVGKCIGESWELADLAEGVSVVSNGPLAGTSLSDLTRRLGGDLLGGCAAMPDGRFPLLLKLLDANEALSLQVHPDEQAVAEIGGQAALKTECWYVLESRDGWIITGVRPGVTAERFRAAVEAAAVEGVVRRRVVQAGEFHYLPAGTVHALGAGVVVAEVQTPSDTTYRVTDWGRGREVHVERSLRCIRLELTGEPPPGMGGDCLLRTPHFSVYLGSAGVGSAPVSVGRRRCAALMFLAGEGTIRHGGVVEAAVPFGAGDTMLLPAALKAGKVVPGGAACKWLEVVLPG